MLRSLVDGLKAGTVKREWILLHGDDRIGSIHGLDDDGTLWREVWDGVEDADLNDFVKCGLFELAGYDQRLGIPNRYYLKEALIVEAVETDFEVSSWHSSSSITVNAANSIVAINSQLSNVNQIIDSMEGVEDSDREQLTVLMQELQNHLASLPETHSEDAEALTENLDGAMRQLARETPNRKLLRDRIDGMIKAAQDIQAIATPVFAVAMQIVQIIQHYAQ